MTDLDRIERWAHRIVVFVVLAWVAWNLARVVRNAL